MCGIAGQARVEGAEVDRATLNGMCNALQHRGPDSRGIHAVPGVGLGIQRLRVIDLATGDQPIFNEDLSVAVVLNGEIYNFGELRRRLEGSGHTFATRSDTEVIAHLYEEEGEECVRHLHGMFALAIWDAPRRRLVLARDRVGKKPLFYAERDGAISFASELNALMQDPEVPRDLDHRALDAYLALRWVPVPLSVYRAVRKLPPASTLVYHEGRVQIERYWRLDYGTKRRVGPREELREELRDQIRRATRRRMIADVPLGAFLSGGVDSSAIVAAMAEASSRPVKTFSIGFEDEAVNELPQARLVAERFGTEHHEFVVRPDALDIVPRVVRQYGEPFADDSAIPSFYLSEMARDHVTVALNGDGGDESFAGYSRYVANRYLYRLGQAPRPARRALGRVADRLPTSGRADSWGSRARRAAATLALEPSARYAAYMTDLKGLRRESLYTPEYAEVVADCGSVVASTIADPWEESTGHDPVDLFLDVDVNTYLPDDLLVKMDIATMASSLEARSPLLDHELMEFAASLPADHKIRGTEKKVALRDALRGWVPDEIIDARKRGFRLPMASWLRGELRDYARETLLDRTARERGFFREPYVRSLLDRHESGAADNSQGIWTLLVFELWHRDFVDAPEALAASGGRGSASH